MTADLQDRMRYVVSKEGGLRAASRKTGIPKTTLSRIIKGEGKTSKRNRNKVNRQFRKIAPDSVKEREKAGLGTGAALVDEATARLLERSYIQSGTEYSVVAHGTYERQIRVGVATEEKEYGRGSTVDEAKANLNTNFDRLAEKYPNWKIKSDSDIQYRIYRKDEAIE